PRDRPSPRPCPSPRSPRRRRRNNHKGRERSRPFSIPVASLPEGSVREGEEGRPRRLPPPRGEGMRVGLGIVLGSDRFIEKIDGAAPLKGKGTQQLPLPRRP